ncbi:MAG: acyl-CoA dehydrogenase family protein, partial [Alcanivoracaceae bacterium]
MARDAVGYALGALNRLASSDFLDRVGIRKFIERLAYTLTKTGFRLITTTARTFKATQKLDKPARLTAPGQTTGLFDLNVTEEQQMIRDSVKSFATEVLRERAEAADAAHKTDDEVIDQALELGLNFFAVPESLGGAASERSAVTNLLIAEDLAYGDMGQAVAILAPMGVANALTSWGTAEQQWKYLPAFADEKPPRATIAITEPHPLFDPCQLKTTARKDGNEYVLNGTKALVPLAAEAELFLVAAATDDGPAVFIIEGGTDGLSCGEDNGMGIRASGQRPLLLEDVRVPAANRLGNSDFDYHQFVDLGTLAWCGMAIGACQGVLDYVIPYCNERKAFGEPISHRQAVAFIIADMAIELDGMRMLVYRAA